MFLLIAKAIFTGGIARYLTAARARDDDEEITEIVSSTFAVNVIVAFLVLLVGLPAATIVDKILVIDEAYVSDARFMMGIMVLSFAARLAFASFESGLIVEQKFVIINTIILSQILLRLVLLLILLIVISHRVIWVAIAT